MQRPHSAPPVYHWCSCGTGYTRATWEKLPRLRDWGLEADDTGPEEWYEVRNCICGSTRMMPLSFSQWPQELHEQEVRPREAGTS